MFEVPNPYKGKSMSQISKHFSNRIFKSSEDGGRFFNCLCFLDNLGSNSLKRPRNCNWFIISSLIFFFEPFLVFLFFLVHLFFFVFLVCLTELLLWDSEVPLLELWSLEPELVFPELLDLLVDSSSDSFELDSSELLSDSFVDSFEDLFEDSSPEEVFTAVL